MVGRASKSKHVPWRRCSQSREHNSSVPDPLCDTGEICFKKVSQPRKSVCEREIQGMNANDKACQCLVCSHFTFSLSLSSECCKKCQHGRLLKQGYCCLSLCPTACFFSSKKKILKLSQAFQCSKKSRLLT